MALYYPAHRAFVGGQEIGRVFHGGVEMAYIFRNGVQMFPPVEELFSLKSTSRVVLESGVKWFEFGFQINEVLTGNAADGWLRNGEYFRLDVQWSIDLVNWYQDKFVNAPVPVVNLGGGIYEYWSRAIHPTDSAFKTGQLQIASGISVYGNDAIQEDARNIPFTALTVAGVSLALGGFPYTMPADAGRMQTDLQPFYPGATVEASSSTVWRIQIPNVAQTLFTQSNRVSWPQYMVEDMYGALVNPVNGGDLRGSWVDANGTAIHTKAFARVRKSDGGRYAAY